MFIVLSVRALVTNALVHHLALSLLLMLPTCSILLVLVLVLGPADPTVLSWGVVY